MPIYREPEHELVGNVQLFVSYSTGLDDNGSLRVNYLLVLVKVNNLSVDVQKSWLDSDCLFFD